MSKGKLGGVQPPDTETMSIVGTRRDIQLNQSLIENTSKFVLVSLGDWSQVFST